MDVLKEMKDISVGIDRPGGVAQPLTDEECDRLGEAFYVEAHRYFTSRSSDGTRRGVRALLAAAGRYVQFEVETCYIHGPRVVTVDNVTYSVDEGHFIAIPKCGPPSVRKAVQWTPNVAPESKGPAHRNELLTTYQTEYNKDRNHADAVRAVYDLGVKHGAHLDIGSVLDQARSQTEMKGEDIIKRLEGYCEAHKARIAELEKENFALSAGQCHGMTGDDFGHFKCGKQYRPFTPDDALVEKMAKAAYVAMGNPASAWTADHAKCNSWWMKMLTGALSTLPPLFVATEKSLGQAFQEAELDGTDSPPEPERLPFRRLTKEDAGKLKAHIDNGHYVPALRIIARALGVES